MKRILKIWFCLSVRIYNKTIEVIANTIKNDKTIAKYELRDIIKGIFRMEIDRYNLPNTTLEYSVFECFTAFKMANSVDNLQKRTIKSGSMSIDGRSIKEGIFYKNNYKRSVVNIVPRNNKETKKAYKERIDLIIEQSKLKKEVNTTAVNKDVINNILST